MKVEIGHKFMGALQKLSGAAEDFREIAEEGLEPEDYEQPSSPRPTPENSSYLIVGKATATKGSTAIVEILGATTLPVQGFGMQIGCSPLLTLKKAEVTPELIQAIGLPLERIQPDGKKTPTTLHAIASQGKYGGLGDLLAVFVGFFEEITAASSLRPEGSIRDTVIPSMTPLVRLHLEVSEDAARTRYELDNASFKYGRPMKNAKGQTVHLRQETVYATAREVAKHGIKPELVSGWVDVLSATNP